MIYTFSYFLIYRASCLINLGDTFVTFSYINKDTGVSSINQGGFGINQGWDAPSPSSKETRVSLYSAGGWQRDLAPLNTPRRSHGCASYTDTSGQEVNACS